MHKTRLSTQSALAAFSLAALFTLGACAPAATDSGNNNSGSGGSRAGSGGSSSGSGGSASSGSGGSPSGSGGSTSGGRGGSGAGGSASGTGGSPSGTGGSASGTGGSPSGTGGAAAGTGGTTGTPDAGGGMDTASATPTFTSLFTEVFGSASCAGAACHTGGAPKGGIDFNTKEKAHMTLSTHKTQLISRIKSTNAAQRMPKGKDPLSPATIAKIEAWVNAGAKND